MQGVSHRFPPGAWRPGEEERPPVDCLGGNRIAQGTDSRTLAEERAVHAAAGLLQEILGDAQFALERRRALRDARFERGIGGLQRVRRAPAFVIQLRVPDRAGDLIGDDRHQAAIVAIEGLPQRAFD